MRTPRELAERVQASGKLPPGIEERFVGYGVTGLPFRSGHVLAMRRFTGSSIGEGYASVWHRSPSGEWSFYQNIAPELACPRYFGPALQRVLRCPIDVQWDDPTRLSIRVDGGDGIDWTVRLSSTLATGAMNAMTGRIPGGLWRRPTLLRAMGLIASQVLGAGRLSLTGRLPSGQRFAVNPLAAWVVRSSRARVGGKDIGPPGPLMEQARLGDFWIPQRGLFMVGRALMEPLDTGRHRLAIPVPA